MEGGAVGRKGGRRGQRKGQIYFLCTVDLDDGPLWGHRGLWLCGFPQGRRSQRSPRTRLQAYVCAIVSRTCVCVCVWVSALGLHA